MVVDTTRPREQGQWSAWELHPRPATLPKLQSCFRLLRGEANPGNPGKLERDGKSGQGLEPGVRAHESKFQADLL